MTRKSGRNTDGTFGPGKPEAYPSLFAEPVNTVGNRYADSKPKSLTFSLAANI
jgi:hypothetical protein